MIESQETKERLKHLGIELTILRRLIEFFDKVMDHFKVLEKQFGPYQQFFWFIRLACMDAVVIRTYRFIDKNPSVFSLYKFLESLSKNKPALKVEAQKDKNDIDPKKNPLFSRIEKFRNNYTAHLNTRAIAGKDLLGGEELSVDDLRSATDIFLRLFKKYSPDTLSDPEISKIIDPGVELEQLAEIIQKIR